MIKSIISRLSMFKTGKSFWDNVGKRKVYYWQDCYFDQYVASYRFGERFKLIKNRKDENI
jgi:hypothetical protein